MGLIDFETTALVTGYEAAAGLAMGAFGVLSLWIAAMTWRTRNGGTITKWICLAMVCLGIDLVLGTTAPIVVAWKASIQTNVAARCFFFFGGLADTIAVGAFAWTFLPRRTLVVKKVTVIETKDDVHG